MLGAGLGPRCKSAYPAPGAKPAGPAVKSWGGGKSGATEPGPVMFLPAAPPPRCVPSDEPNEVRGGWDLTEFPRAMATTEGSRSSIGRPLPVAGGSQLTGSRRSSNRREAANFHLRMMVQMATAATIHEAATMRATKTGLGRKEAPSSLDLSVSSGAADAMEVAVTNWVERLADCVELAWFAMSGGLVVGVIAALEETEVCWEVEEEVVAVVVVVWRVVDIDELDWTARLVVVVGLGAAVYVDVSVESSGSSVK